MRQYELKENTREIKYADRKEIQEGCTLNQDFCEPTVVKSFLDKKEALDALKEYETSISEVHAGRNSYFKVVEYYVEENVYDSEGEWIGGGDVWGFSHMPDDMQIVQKTVIPKSHPVRAGR